MQAGDVAEFEECEVSVAVRHPLWAILVAVICFADTAMGQVEHSISVEPDRPLARTADWQVSTTRYAQGCVAVLWHPQAFAVSPPRPFRFRAAGSKNKRET